MSARLPEVLTRAGAARRLLLREGLTSVGLLEVEFLGSLPGRRIGPGPTAMLPLPTLEGEVPQLRLVLAGEEPAAYGGLELRLNSGPPGTGASGRLELRLGWTLPHPDGTRLCGPLLLAVDRPPQPLAQPAEEVPV